jgi:hypothetical protein
MRSYPVELHGRAFTIVQHEDGTFEFPPELAALRGMNQALKPAHEPWVLARKPLVGTVAGNVLAHGTGALNIDATRVATNGERVGPGSWSDPSNRQGAVGADLGFSGNDVDAFQAAQAASVERANTLGRWPSNFVLSHAEGCVQVGTRTVKTGTAVKRNLPDDGADQQIDVKAPTQRGEDETYGDEDGNETVPEWECAEGCPVAALDAQSGDVSGRPGSQRRGTDESAWTREGGKGFGMRKTGAEYGDTGGASRFFPTFEVELPDPAFMYVAKAPSVERPVGVDGTRHPTVKPLALMRWLVRLVTPPSSWHCPACSMLPTAVPARASDGIEVGDDPGAPVGDGRAPRAAVEAARGGAPQERGEDGQPDREPGSAAEAGARPDAETTEGSDLSALRRCGVCGTPLETRPGVILDPFAGSGTTVEAAILEGFSIVAVEMTSDYLPLIRQRIERGYRGGPRYGEPKAKAAPVSDDQATLF